MKVKRIAAIIFLFCIFLLPVAATAGQVEGVIEGYSCATKNLRCPADKQDPIIALEQNFVIVVPERGFYIIPNIDRAVLARHFLEKARITGEVNEKYKSIKAEQIEIWEKGAWKTVWSREMVDEMEKWLKGDKLRH